MDIGEADPDALHFLLALIILQRDIGVFKPDGERARLHRNDSSALVGDDAAVAFAVDEEVVGAVEDVGRELLGVYRLDAEKGGLHGTGGDLERLKEIGPDGKGHDGRHDEDFHVLPPEIPWGGGEHLVAEFEGFLVQLLQPGDIERLEQLGITGLKIHHGLKIAGREGVLGVDAVALKTGVNQLGLGDDLFGFAGEEKVEHERAVQGRLRVR